MMSFHAFARHAAMLTIAFFTVYAHAYFMARRVCCFALPCHARFAAFYALELPLSLFHIAFAAFAAVFTLSLVLRRECHDVCRYTRALPRYDYAAPTDIYCRDSCRHSAAEMMLPAIARALQRRLRRAMRPPFWRDIERAVDNICRAETDC